MILFTTRGRFCLSVLMHLVHTLPSRSGPVFSNYPDMHRVPRVHTKSRVPLSSGHLAWIISVRSPRSKRDFDSEASTYLSHKEWPHACCSLSLSHLAPCSFTHLFASQVLSLALPSSTLSGSASLRGFAYALHAQTVAPFTTTRTGPWSQIRGELTIWLFL